MREYVLGMFPYPSGTPHLGHVRVYTITDTRARWARLRGREVLHPMGWDAFGLPAENAAIRRGVAPEAWTAANIARMRAVFDAMGWSFDWDREIDTSSPAYARWTQQLFLRLWERGLAVRADGWVHYCPGCATVLADEQVDGGGCWRCHTAVVRRRIPQWTLRISAYAQRLWDDLDRLSEWDPRAVAIQRHWIGRTEGSRAVVRTDRGDVAVFAPTPTIGPLTAVLVAPEHPIAWESPDPAVRAAAAAAVRRSPVERAANPPRIVVPTGATTAEGLPVLLVDQVVPGFGVETAPYAGGDPQIDAVARPGDAVAITSEPAVAWRLRDWSVGRQRRWGCPIPLVHCASCGTVPADAFVGVDDPVDRPCPTCGGPAVRERETLDTFVDSAWYAYRYTDPHGAEVPFDRAAADAWMPVGVYVGGLDHAAQHMLYFRFFAKVLADLGMAGFDEPVTRFVCNGVVQNPDGVRMSKSGASGIDPGELLKDHSADAIRLAILADAPVERDRRWDPASPGVRGRFLARWGERIDRFIADHPGDTSGGPWPDADVEAAVAGLLARLDRDLEALALHVAVARLHELAAAIDPILADPSADPAAARGIVRDVLVAASPLVPGWVEARWPPSWGDRGRWPVRATSERAGSVVVQVDGRTVARIAVPSGSADAAAEDIARSDPRVVARLAGRPVTRVIVVPGRLINLVTG